MAMHALTSVNLAARADWFSIMTGFLPLTDVNMLLRHRTAKPGKSPLTLRVPEQDGSGNYDSAQHLLADKCGYALLSHARLPGAASVSEIHSVFWSGMLTSQLFGWRPLTKLEAIPLNSCLGIWHVITCSDCAHHIKNGN